MGTDSPALAGSLGDLRPRTLLHFLGLTGKTGVLKVRQRERTAAVWLHAGLVLSVDGDAVDAVVELLRMPTGEFGFEETVPPPDADGLPVAAALAGASLLLATWEDAAQVVPSMSLSIELQRTDAGEDGTLSSDAWAVSVAVAGGHTTPAAVAQELRWRVLRTCRAVKELVESGRAALLPPVGLAPQVLSAPAHVVLTGSGTTEAQPLWPGATVDAGGGWRAPWYDPGE